MKLICLAENTTQNPELIAQHGLSLYLQVGGKNILFDFGQTGETLLHNAKILGVDLSAVDFALLSHGHYDHGGGLEAFLQINATAKVYLHKKAFEQYYNGTQKYIGLNPALQNHPQLCFVDQDTQIGQGLTLRLPKSQRVAPLRHGELTQKTGEQFLPDDFSHELYLEVEQQGKTILFSGCAHQGIENIVNWFTPHLFVGGMHLSHFSVEELTPVATTLGQYPTHYVTGHCTGVDQREHLKEFCKITYLSCGKALAI